MAYQRIGKIEIIGELPGLQRLFLQSLANVCSFPNMRNAGKLRFISLETMKGLKDYTELEFAPTLEDFMLTDGSKNDPEDLVPVLRNPNVRFVSAGFGSDKKNKIFARMVENAGKQRYNYAPFVYL